GARRAFDPRGLHDRTPPRRAHRPPDRGGGRFLLLRNERPHPDHLGVLAGRRRVVLLPDVPAERRAHDLAVRNDRRRRRGRTCPRGRRWWSLNETRAHDGGMWGARRGSGVDPVLPRRRPRLRLLLPLPGAGGTAGGRARTRVRQVARAAAARGGVSRRPAPTPLPRPARTPYAWKLATTRSRVCSPAGFRSRHST